MFQDTWNLNKYPANIYLFKLNIRKTRKRCAKSTIKTPEQHQWRVSIVDFEQVNVSRVVLRQRLSLITPKFSGNTNSFLLHRRLSSCYFKNCNFSLDFYHSSNIVTINDLFSGQFYSNLNFLLRHWPETCLTKKSWVKVSFFCKVTIFMNYHEPLCKFFKLSPNFLVFPHSLSWFLLKGVLRPILCIDINRHSDRKSKNYVKFI